jgi:hypothetical protein
VYCNTSQRTYGTAIVVKRTPGWEAPKEVREADAKRTRPHDNDVTTEEEIGQQSVI